jgi:hypothetical protein
MTDRKRCSECVGQKHHWCTEIRTDDGEHLQCKHCDAIASECPECMGDGCDECEGGIVEILDCVEMADRCLALGDRRGIEWDALAEELRDEVVRLRAERLRIVEWLREQPAMQHPRALADAVKNGEHISCGECERTGEAHHSGHVYFPAKT